MTGNVPKSGGVNFVASVLADGASCRAVAGIGNWILDLAVIFSGRAMRRKISSRVAVLTFSLFPRNQFNPDGVQHQRLVTVIGDDDANRQEAVIAVVRLEDSSLLRSGERINGDDRLLVIMCVMRGITGCRRRPAAD